MRQLSTEKDSRRKGVALVLAALLCMALVPMVGLAIDGANAYMMRSVISTALDAAALAGARSLNSGASVAAQTASATAAAQSIFNADLTANSVQLGSVTSSVTVALNDTTHIRSVSVTASGSLPLLFMPVLGVKTTNINMTATAQRRDVNVVLVLDHSGSMSGVLSSMQTDASDFVNMFASGRDNIGLVTFAGAGFLAYAPKTSFQTDSPNVPALIGSLTTYNGATNTAQAIWMAYQQLVSLNQPGAINVIVVFTDGLANTFTANFQGLVAGAAGCTALINPVAGVLLSDINEVGTYGLSDPTAQSINDPTEGRAAPQGGGCGNIANNWSISSYLTGLPSTDTNGNSTNGSGSISAYAPVDLTHITPVSVTNAGLDAFDDAANRIRSDSSLKPIIYTIGLGNNPGLPPDTVLLARIANDPASPSFNSSQATGLSVFSPTIAQLHGAFIRIASEVLRLTR